MPYRNPVLPGFYPDPSVCRVGEDYYLVTSSFEYFPGVPIFHSRDLVNWRQIGHCLTRTSQLELATVPSSAGIWAPTIRHHDGRFYMSTVLVEKCNFSNAPGPWRLDDWVLNKHFFVTAEDPAGEWSEPIPLSGGGIDPSLCFDDDGTVYLTHSDKGMLYQSTLDVATGERTSETRAIWGGTVGKDTEGPHLYKIDGRYYLIVAEGSTSYGHLVAFARSDTPWGPWESCPWNPVLTHRNSSRPIQATGHADIVQAHDGSWWMVLLGVRARGFPPFHTTGRETYLVPIEWEDGWPRVSTWPVELEMQVPTLAPQQERPALWRDDFDGAALDMTWNYLRHPNDAVRLEDGKLVLGPSAVSLDDLDSPAFLGHRQEQLECRIEVALDFQPAADGDEAGLTVLQNERHHYEVALRQEDGEQVAILRRRIGDLVKVEARKAAPAGRVRLRIDVEEFAYRFSFAPEGGELQALGSGETLYLSSEVAGGFTGVYAGPYFIGAGRALVDWFELESVLDVLEPGLLRGVVEHPDPARPEEDESHERDDGDQDPGHRGGDCGRRR